MRWCLECHRNPEKFIRPRDQVFNMAYERPSDDPGLGERLVKEYKIAERRDVSCTSCSHVPSSELALELTVMDFSAIRSRLAGSEGRLYWRSLGELADTAAVPRVPASRVPRAGVAVERSEGPPRVPEADERVAGAGRRQRLHEAAGRKDRPYVRQPERPRAGQAAVLRDGRPVWRRRRAGARREPRRASDQSRRQSTNIRPASAATDIFTQAADPDLYDPDRAQTVTLSRRSARLG